MAGMRTVRREISTAERADARLPFFDFLRDESSRAASSSRSGSASCSPTRRPSCGRSPP